MMIQHRNRNTQYLFSEVLKRVIAILIILTSGSITSQSLASGSSLPATNTDSVISFSGFEWYSDYPTVIKTAKEKGIVNHFGWSRDNFDEGKLLTPHWTTLLNSLNWAADSEKNCGGYVYFSSDLPKVAGYKIEELKMYFMWNPDNYPTLDYSKKDAVQLYMARYEFDVIDKKGCYEDLINKLKSLYGNNPYTGTYGLFRKPYVCWVNKEHALIGLSYDEYEITLVYCAPESEEKLVQVEKMVRDREVKNASNDTSGL